MSESKTKRNARQLWLTANPSCYFCDGQNIATSADHVPPQACFPKGFFPEGYVFPACEACNNGTKKEDQIFGLVATMLDFNEARLKEPEHEAHLNKLRRGIANNYPEALPDLTTAGFIYRIGEIYTPEPVAASLAVNPSIKFAIKTIATKLTHALYLKESGRRLTKNHSFFTGMYQPQRSETRTLHDYFLGLLPNLTVGGRSNIKEYGERFQYLSGFKTDEDFFVYAAQFGDGLILWGIAVGPGIALPESGPMNAGSALKGACGAGSRPTVDEAP